MENMLKSVNNIILYKQTKKQYANAQKCDP